MQELSKFTKEDEIYFNYIEELDKYNYCSKDIIYDFTVFVGQVNLARFIFFYELYKKVLELNGDIADVGTYKGASFLLMSKLVKIFEPYNSTKVYGFDWFEGMKPSKDDDVNQKGKYIASYDTLNELIKLQGLENVAVLNKLDLTKQTKSYLEERPSQRYKIVFIDCGIKNVLEETIPAFWSRLVNGGIMILDHYNNSHSPSESSLLEKTIGDRLIKQMPFNRQPTAYVIK